MSDDAKIAQLHAAAIVEMEDLKAFSAATSRAEGYSDRKMVLAYVDQDDKVHALAGAMVSAVKGLIVHSVVVHPAELNNQDSKAWFGLKHGLELLAVTIDVKLDNTPISQEPQPIAVRISRARDGEDGTERLSTAEESPGALPASLGLIPSWTRWASRAKDLDAAVETQDYGRAAEIQAEFDALSREDHEMLDRLAAALGAAVEDEDYTTAAKIKAELDAALQKGAK